MKVFGLTGGTGTGKTTAVGVVEKLGGYAIDTDAVYHDLLVSSKSMVSEIDASFPGVVTDGVLDRKALGAIVFDDEEKLLLLNKITHKFVTDKVAELLSEAEKKGYPFAAVDGVAILETPIAAMCDRTIAVTAPYEDRLDRIMKRESIGREYAALRLSAQKPDSYYEEKCDIVLRNDYSDRADFEKLCTEVFTELIG